MKLSWLNIGPSQFIIYIRVKIHQMVPVKGHLSILFFARLITQLNANHD